MDVSLQRRPLFPMSIVVDSGPPIPKDFRTASVEATIGSKK